MLKTTLAVLGLSAATARAQTGIAVAMYVPHALQTLTGSQLGTWVGSFEAPLTTAPRGQKAKWAAFCVSDADATCFSEPASDIASGEYTEAGEVINFTVENIDIPASEDDYPGVVCYVATVFEKGQICSKPALDYREVGPVSTGNSIYAWSRNVDIGSRIAENPVLKKIADAAKETVDMIQRAFGRLQVETAQDIEASVQAYDSSQLKQELAGEIAAVADMLRPAPSPEAVDELQASLEAEIAAIADHPGDGLGDRPHADLQGRAILDIPRDVASNRLVHRRDPGSRRGKKGA